MLTYNKQYGKDEEPVRFACFVKNLRRIDELNAAEPQHGAIHAINSFADMCPHEFGAVYHGLKLRGERRKKEYAELQPSHKGGHSILRLLADVYNHYVRKGDPNALQKTIPTSVDWREKGAVTEVKNQGQCGSCWAFSSTGNMEGLHFLKTGKLVSLSEEELVECASDDGCNGGLMDDAFAWVQQNGGITTEEDYPYTSETGTSGDCRQGKLQDVAATVRSFVDIPEDEDQIAAWVAEHGPLSIAVDAAQDWQLYSGGIKKSCNITSLDHGVLLVGYGASHGTKYWIVKNSWGASWGEGGYIRLERGVNCNGIKQHAVSAR